MWEKTIKNGSKEKMILQQDSDGERTLHPVPAPAVGNGVFAAGFNQVRPHQQFPSDGRSNAPNSRCVGRSRCPAAELAWRAPASARGQGPCAMLHNPGQGKEAAGQTTDRVACPGVTPLSDLGAAAQRSAAVRDEPTQPDAGRRRFKSTGTVTFLPKIEPFHPRRLTKNIFWGKKGPPPEKEVSI